MTHKQVGEVLTDVFTLFKWLLVGKIEKQLLKIVLCKQKLLIASDVKLMRVLTEKRQTIKCFLFESRIKGNTDPTNRRMAEK